MVTLCYYHDFQLKDSPFIATSKIRNIFISIGPDVVAHTGLSLSESTEILILYIPLIEKLEQC